MSPALAIAVERNESARKDALQQLVNELRQASQKLKQADRFSVQSAEFGELIQYSQRLLEMSDVQMASLLKVARPTIGRWSRGESTPARLMASAVLLTIADEARERIKRVQKSAQRVLEGELEAVA